MRTEKVRTRSAVSLWINTPPVFGDHVTMTTCGVAFRKVLLRPSFQPTELPCHTGSPHILMLSEELLLAVVGIGWMHDPPDRQASVLRLIEVFDGMRYQRELYLKPTSRQDRPLGSRQNVERIWGAGAIIPSASRVMRRHRPATVARRAAR